MDSRPRLEVADVVREYGDNYRRAHHPSAAQEKVMGNISVCRTPVLGGHVDECRDGCGHIRVSYNSCRDRHCPKCQGPQRAEWLANRLERVLPTEHFHVVFTIPDDLNPLALRNKKAVFKILFDSASQTLLELARDGKRLGATIGVTAVLHTWDKTCSSTRTSTASSPAAGCHRTARIGYPDASGTFYRSRSSTSSSGANSSTRSIAPTNQAS